MAREISSQPALWLKAGGLAGDLRPYLPEVGERLAIIGCGTSLFMGQAAGALYESRKRGEVDAFPATEVPASRKYDRYLFISRSGRTTDTVRALEQLPKGTQTVAITAEPESPLAERASHKIALTFADEQSVVQTRFATTVLALFRACCGDDLAALANQAEAALTERLPVDPMQFEQFVFLGRHWTVGLANEAALKLREVTGVWAESYPAMEYRHGPIAALGRRSLVWALSDLDGDLKTKLTQAGATVIHASNDPMVELIRIQRLALARAERMSRDPDKPPLLSRAVVLEESNIDGKPSLEEVE